MGLDMTIRKEYYAFGKSHKMSIALDGETIPQSPYRTLVEVDAIYWRKVNPIHRWMVDNVQDGKDNCDEYYLSIGNLKALLEKVKACVKDWDNAPAILPCADGFFFGLYTTDSDEYRKEFEEDYISTISELEKLIDDLQNAIDNKIQMGAYYQSSW